MRAPKSLTLLDEVIATKNATFMDNWEMEHVIDCSHDVLVSVDRMKLKSR